MSNSQLTKIDNNLELEVLASRLFKSISSYVVEARQNISRSIDTEMVKAYWLMGRDIVEVNQEGNLRAKYGSALLNKLSEKLKNQHGKGFSVSTLSDARQFYSAYQEYCYASRYTDLIPCFCLEIN